ncbi:MAG: hypothetical protein QHJ73_18745, partial [Armatimonadota bacterium]|nr:hypothetical protein [Armatimonadota bacterium]
GNYYARAMASWAVLLALSGFRYSAASHTLWLAPRQQRRRFTTFFSTASGWGTLSLTNTALTIHLVEGELKVDRVCLTRGKKTLEIPWGKVARAGKKARLKLP